MATSKTKTAAKTKPAAKKRKTPSRDGATAARRAHNPKTSGPTPVPATKADKGRAPGRRKALQAIPDGFNSHAVHQHAGVAQPEEHRPCKSGVEGSIPSASTTRELTPKEALFVGEYLIDLNATQAYMRSHPGVKVTTASTEGVRLLGNPWVQAAITEARQRIAANLEITAEKAVSAAWAIVMADARELVEHVIGCCRHCHGIDHRFQRTEAEMERDRAKHAKAQDIGETNTDFDEEGGTGYDARNPPNPQCPECWGRGIGRTHIKDTRSLSPQAAALYAGIKETKEGMEVKMHSRLDALEKVFKHLGLYEKDNKQKVDPLSTLLAGMGRSAMPVVKDPGSDV